MSSLGETISFGGGGGTSMGGRQAGAREQRGVQAWSQQRRRGRVGVLEGDAWGGIGNRQAGETTAGV